MTTESVWPTGYARTKPDPLWARQTLESTLGEEFWPLERFYAKDVLAAAETDKRLCDALLAYALVSNAGFNLNIFTVGRVLGKACSNGLRFDREERVKVLKKCGGYMNRTLFYFE